MLDIGKDGVFFRMKRNGIEQSTCKTLEENLLQSAFHQILEEEFTFQQTDPHWSCFIK
jgi:hypothetical protein